MQFPYFRFNVERDVGDIGLGDWEREEEIAVHTTAYLEETEAEEKKLVCVNCLTSNGYIEPITQGMNDPSTANGDHSQAIRTYQDAMKKDPIKLLVMVQFL